MITASTPPWEMKVHDLQCQSKIEYDALKALAQGTVGLVVLRGLIDQRELESQLSSLKCALKYRRTTHYVNGTLTTLGPYLAKHIENPDIYFDDAKKTKKILSEAGFSLDIIVKRKLEEVFGPKSIFLAAERPELQYASCVIRIHGDGVANPLHNDNIMRDAVMTPLLVKNFSHQLSCVVCLQECDHGGELLHYQRQWCPADEKYKIRNGLGYDAAVVTTFPPIRYKPKVGDVYLLNPAYYHEISPVSGNDRITLGFFLGISENNFSKVATWS
ncbi:hypothetical protein AAC691_13910 [Nguyenibacter vanlangensis]|uniref:Prolyl 4-hydroxylase alpha subunit Fe(2+) 2OG dioxygenase domain-containing protein n=1 Tax=Nguyenibacter vanlangensis TaxID=1216886 RepID=A0ABZ3D0W1_9PROT